MDDRDVFQFSRQCVSTPCHEHLHLASLLLMHFIAASNGFASRYISSMHEYQRATRKRKTEKEKDEGERERERGREREEEREEERKRENM